MTQLIQLRKFLLAAALAGSGSLWAADHLDTPSVIADPLADIGDLYSWTS